MIMHVILIRIYIIYVCTSMNISQPTRSTVARVSGAGFCLAIGELHNLLAAVLELNYLMGGLLKNFDR